MTEGLEVRIIVEQPPVAAVRDDVVDIGGHRHAAFLAAFNAERVFS